MDHLMIVPLTQLVLSMVLLTYASVIRKLDGLYCSMAILDIVGMLYMAFQFSKMGIGPDVISYKLMLFGMEIISMIMFLISITILDIKGEVPKKKTKKGKQRK